MERTAAHTSTGRTAQHKRRRSIPAIVGLGNHVDDLVVSATDKVHELELGDGTHAGERGSKRRTNNGGFSDRRVDDTIATEVMNEAFGHFERAAINTDIFANAEDSRIALHLFPDT